MTIKGKTARSERPARILSLLLALVLVVGICVPTAALAGQGDDTPAVFDAGELEEQLADNSADKAAAEDAGGAEGQDAQAEAPAASEQKSPAADGSKKAQQDDAAYGPNGTSGAATEADFIYDGAGTITGYTGTDKDPVIPATIGGKPVTAIGDRAFYGKGLYSVELPDGLLLIGDSAFSANMLTSIEFPRSLRTIGKSAFAYNSLKSVELPPLLQDNQAVQPAIPGLGEYAFRSNHITNVKTMGAAVGSAPVNAWPQGISALPKGVFMQNNLKAVSANAQSGGIPPFAGSSLKAIGNSAFEVNEFSDVDVPDTLTYGDEATAEASRVFADNGRYVLVSGNNSKLASYSIAGAFGELKASDLAEITVEGYDEQGVQIYSDTQAADLTRQVASVAELPMLNNSFTVAIPQLNDRDFTGASTGTPSADKKSLTFTITSSPITVRLNYRATNGTPLFSGLDAITLAMGGAGGRVSKADIMAGVTATSADGTRDLTQQINVSRPAASLDDVVSGSWYLDTFIPGSFLVDFSVTDPANGATARGRRVVNINFSIANVGIGNGWTYADFTYQGDALTGFSAQGKAKLADPARAAEVWLPELNITDENSLVAIARIGDHAFVRESQDILGIRFDRLASSLERIEEEAFAHKNGYTSEGFPKVLGYNGAKLDLSPLAKLKYIGENAFAAYKGNGEELRLDSLTDLRDIEDCAFAYFNGSNLVIGNLPILNRIGKWAFLYYEGSGTTLQLAGLKNLSYIEDFAFGYYNGKALQLGRLANLVMIGQGAFRSYVGKGQSLAFDGFSSLALINKEAFKSFNGDNVAIEQLPKLKQIGEGSFRSYEGAGKTLAITDLPDLKYIMSEAFFNFSGSELRLANLPKLELINQQAFSNYIGANTTLDLSSFTELKTIGLLAFERFDGKGLIFGSLPKLEKIDYGSFFRYGYSSTVAGLDLSGLPALATIGNSAFACYTGPKIDFGQKPALKAIYSRAFARYGYNNASRSDIDFRGLSAVQLVGESAFAHYMDTKGTALDLSPMTSLQQVDRSAFSMKSGSVIYLPAGVTTLDPRAFLAEYTYTLDPNTPPNSEWFVYTLPNGAATTLGQSANPITFIDNYYKQRGSIYVNTVTAAATLKDTQGTILEQTTIRVNGAVGSTVDVYAPALPGYKAVAGQPGSYSDAKGVYKKLQPAQLTGNQIEFIYQAGVRTTDPYLQNVQVEIANVVDGPLGKGIYPLGSDMKLKVSITSSGGGLSILPEDAYVVIPLTQFSEAVSVAGSVAVKNYYVERGRLIVVFNNTGLGAGGIDFDVSQKFNETITPYSHEDEFSVALFDPAGALVAKHDKSSGIALPTLKVLGASSATLTKYVNGSSDLSGKLVTAGRVAQNQQHPQTNSYLMAGSEQDVVFSWRVGTLSSRMYSSFTITEELPKYIKRDASAPGGESEVYAQFIAADNPGWTYDANTNKLTYTYQFNFPVPNEYVRNVANGLSLKLRFPEARTYLAQSTGSTTEFEAQIVLDTSMVSHPSGIYPSASNPPFVRVSASQSYTLAGLDVTGIYGKVAASGHYHYPNLERFFYDDDVERNMPMAWELSFHNTWNTPYYDVVFEDYGLDDCMYFYGIKNPFANGGYPMHVTALDASGNKVYDAKVTEAEFVFPANISENTIKSVKIEMLGGFTVPAGYRSIITVLTKVKSAYASSQMYDVPLANGHRHGGSTIAFENKSFGSMKTDDPVVGAEYKIPFDNQVTIARPENTMGVSKTAEIVGKNGTLVTAGDNIDYTLGVSGARNPVSRITNFKMVDMLPSSVSLVSVKPTNAFSSSVNAKVEVKDNYNGSGQTAVIFTADQLLLDKAGDYHEDLAVIRVEKTPMNASQTGWFENDVYMRAGTETALRPGSGTAGREPSLVASSAAMGDNQPNSHAAVNLNSLNSSVFTIVKQVGEAGGPYTRAGIETKPGAAIQYKYNIYNPDTTTYRDNVVFFDVFPYVGDNMMDKDAQGNTLARGSQFANSFRQGLETTNGVGSTAGTAAGATPFPTGTQFFYTTDQFANNSRAFVNNANNWRTSAQLGFTTEAQWATVTGFKVVMPSSWRVAANSQYSFLADFRAPTDYNLAGTGKQAVNSFAVTDNIISQGQVAAGPVESNKVTNAIAKPSGSIVLTKTDSDGVTLLPGAEFHLTDGRTGNVVKKQFSDANGQVVFNDVAEGDYFIVERKAPAGYSPSTQSIFISAQQLRNSFNGPNAAGSFFAGKVLNYKLPPAPGPQGSVKVKKAGVTGAPLAGAVFKLTGPSYPNDTSVIAQRSTNQQGEASFSGMPLGSYLLEETSAPGHLTANFTPVVVNITADGQTVEYPGGGAAVVNDKASLDMIKIGIYHNMFIGTDNWMLDATMGRRLSDVQFKLYDGTVAQYVAAPGSAQAAAGVGVTPANGKTDTLGRLSFTNLKAGAHYTLVETAPAQYPELTMRPGAGPNQTYGDADDTPGIYEVWVDENGFLWIDGHQAYSTDLIIGNNVDQTKMTQAALLQKTDASGNPLQGATFRLTPTFKAGANVPSPLPTRDLTTNVAGEIAIETSDLASWNMPEGDVEYYTLTEIAAPAGYVLPSPAPSFVFSSGMPQTFKAVNEKLSLDLFKYEKVAGNVAETMQFLGLGSELQAIQAAHGGAQYNVRVADLSAAQLAMIDAAVAANPMVRMARVAGDTQLELRRGVAGATVHVQEQANPSVGFDAVTDAFGRIAVPAGFNLDSTKIYEAFETRAPFGYLLNAKTYVVNPALAIASAGFDGSVHVAIEDLVARASLTITKISAEDGNPMPGVSFRVAKKDGSWSVEKTTDANGLLRFTDLDFGDYIITETATLADYELPAAGFEESLAPTSPSAFFVLQNYRKTGSVSIEKLSDNGTPYDTSDDYPLSGVEFALEKWNPLLPVPGVSGLLGSWEPYEGTDDQGDFGMDVQDPNDGTGYYPPRATDATGRVSFGKLPLGRYRIQERVLPGSVYGKPTFTFVSSGDYLDGIAGDEFTLDATSPLNLAVKAVNPMLHGGLDVEKTVADGGDKDAYFTFQILKRVPGANGGPSTLVPVDLTTMPHSWDAIVGVDMPNDGDNNPGSPELGFIQLKHGQKFVLSDVLVGDYVVKEAAAQGYTTQWRVKTSPLPVGPPGLPPFLPPVGPGDPGFPPLPGVPGLPPAGRSASAIIQSQPLGIAMQAIALYGANGWTDGLEAQAPVEADNCTSVEFLNTPVPDGTEPPDVEEPPASTDPPAQGGGWTGGSGGKLPHTGTAFPAALLCAASLMLLGMTLISARRQPRRKAEQA